MIPRSTSKGFSIRLQCVGICCATFSTIVERKEDVAMSHIGDIGEMEGYAIYRDRNFIKCPHCRSLCRLVPGLVTVEVTKVD